MDARSLSGQETETLADEVMESLGEPKDAANQVLHNDTKSAEREGGQDDLPPAIKERLARQERKHQRELKRMQEQMDVMHSRMAGQPNTMDNHSSPPMDSYDAPQGTGVDEQIHKAVSYALQHKEREERKAKEAESLAHVHRKFMGLKDHLDGMHDKYEDFGDVVLGHDVPFTPAMREALLVLPKAGSGSAGEVLYKLGKNRSELERIAKLHPVDQAEELVRLSNHMMEGRESKAETPRLLGQVKNNPVTNSNAITEKTPVSEIRKRMKNRDGFK